MDRAALDRRVAELVAEYGSPDASPGVLLCDRHRAEAVAFTVVEPDLSYRDLTFGELGELSARFAAGLARLGVGPGDAVATLMGKSAELVVALLGIWRRGAVHVPLFTAFAAPRDRVPAGRERRQGDCGRRGPAGQAGSRRRHARRAALAHHQRRKPPG